RDRHADRRRDEVSSEPGRGTTFVIRFPRVDAPVTPAEPLRPASTETGSETVLLVEDGDVVRALARRVLERHGYIVLEASNGHEAIGVAETHDGDIHLVLTDVVMPGLRGHEVADRIAASRPAVRVIFMSGYADEALLG